MRPEDIRKLYHQEEAATDDEAETTRAEARTDPAQARRLILTLYAMASEDRVFELLLNLFLKAATMQLIVNAAADDERFALHCAETILDGMDQLAKQERGRVGRGRSKTTKSA